MWAVQRTELWGGPPPFAARRMGHPREPRTSVRAEMRTSLVVPHPSLREEWGTRYLIHMGIKAIREKLNVGRATN